MRTRTAVCLSLSAVVAAGALSPAIAGPKPVTKTYQATAPTPDPTPITGATGGNCSPTLPTAKHEAEFKIPFPGVLTVKVHQFQGDWALALLDASGEKIADHDNSVTEPIDAPSQITMKFKKPTTITVRACNFSGGPTATVDISLVPLKK